jgi:hypothetical protein
MFGGEELGGANTLQHSRGLCNVYTSACPSSQLFTIMKMFVAAFSEELSSVLTRRSVVTTEEEHHVSLFGHSEDGVQIEEVSNICRFVPCFSSGG